MSLVKDLLLMGKAIMLGKGKNSVVEATMANRVSTSGKLTYDDYVCFPDDGRRHEIIDGDHFVNPAPSTYHQTVSKRLQFQLYSQIELRGLGILFNAPVDVHMSEHDIVQPDLVVILKENQTIITPSKVKGVPDLLVEIISPTSRNSDRQLKRNLYESSGVTEYWIVDPFDHSLDQLVLLDGRYQLQPAAEEVRPRIVDDVIIQLTDVW